MVVVFKSSRGVFFKMVLKLEKIDQTRFLKSSKKDVISHISVNI